MKNLEVLTSSICVLIKSLFFQIAVFIGPVLACLFSVFGFCLALVDTPYQFRWLHHISYFRAGFHVAVHSVYGFNRTRMHCSKGEKIHILYETIQYIIYITKKNNHSVVLRVFKSNS